MTYPPQRGIKKWLEACLLQEGERIKSVDQWFAHQEEEGERFNGALQEFAHQEEEGESFNGVLQEFYLLKEKKWKV